MLEEGYTYLIWEEYQLIKSWMFDDGTVVQGNVSYTDYVGRIKKISSYERIQRTPLIKLLTGNKVETQQ